MSSSREEKDALASIQLITIMKAMNLQPPDKGNCRGLAYLASVAITLGNSDAFITRIQTIHEPSFLGQLTGANRTRERLLHEAEASTQQEMKGEASGSFSEWYKTLESEQRKIADEKIHKIFNKKISEHPDSAKLSEVAEIQTFLQSADVLQRPAQFDYLFETGKAPIALDSLAALPLVMPLALEKKGGLVEVGCPEGVYSESDLKKYFHYLEAVIKSKNVNYPLSFIVGSSNHFITIGYLPNEEKPWIVINPSKFTDKLSKDKLQTDKVNDLAQAVMEAFPGEKQIIVANHVTVTADHKEEATSLVNTWLNFKEKGLFASSMQDIQKITPAKAKYIDPKGGSLLYMAARTGNVEDIRSSLDAGADPKPDQKYPNKKLALTIATIYHSDKSDDDALLQLLVKGGANPNEANEVGMTPLHVAASYGRDLIINKLIELGADANAKTTKEFSVLDAAIEGLRVSTVELLLSSGAKPSSKSLEKIQQKLATEQDLVKKATLSRIESKVRAALMTLKAAPVANENRAGDAALIEDKAKSTPVSRKPSF